MYMEWSEYVPVAKRIAQGRKYAEKIAKKRGFPAQPVANLGRKITTTFWGNSWCENLESYSDFDNRLPRGRTLAKNGSIADLVITKGEVNAIVGGSEVYEIRIEFSLLKKRKWDEIKQRSANSIDSVMSLLQGQFDKSVMAQLSQQNGGLFPAPREIVFDCSCPDWAVMCKHVAAVLYGVGAHLDLAPEKLFLLRGVDHLELVTSQSAADSLVSGPADASLADQDLSKIFGIEFDDGLGDSGDPALAGSAAKTPVKKKSLKKKPTTRKKSATRKTPRAKKAVAKKKPTAKKPVANKKSAVKKQPAAKKPSGKKRVTKRSATAKKSSVKQKSSVKKPSVKKKPAAVKSTRKKTVVKKKTTRKK